VCCPLTADCVCAVYSISRTEELLRYAKIIGDMEWVIGHHIQQRNYTKALSLLKNHDQPSKIEELFYKFAPVLMHHKPKETVDMLIEVVSKQRWNNPFVLVIEPCFVRAVCVASVSRSPVWMRVS
jgi:hypothetical protein